MLDKKKVREIANKYSDEVKKILNPFSVVLFGSYVNGTPHDESDIDIAVIVRNFDGDWYATSVMLYSLKENVSFDIEPHLLDADYDPSGFVEHVIKTGEIIYQSV